jgi:hypothetical protein
VVWNALSLSRRRNLHLLATIFVGSLQFGFVVEVRMVEELDHSLLPESVLAMARTCAG